MVVCARNVTGDNILGEGSSSIRSVGVAYGKEVNMMVKMKDKRGKPKGRVEIIMQIDPIVIISQPSVITSNSLTVSNARTFFYIFMFIILYFTYIDFCDEFMMMKVDLLWNFFSTI